MALTALPGLTPEMLWLADRGFRSFALWRTACATGAALVWRAPATVTLPILERYADGSYRSELRWNQRSSDPDRTPQPVRVVRYTLPVRVRGMQRYV